MTSAEARRAVVLPALDEAGTIASVVERLRGLGQAVVVDDGSSDGTGAVAERAGATVLRHGVNAGYDAALRTGILWAVEHGYDVVVTMDADGQHDPEIVARLAQPIERGEADLVLGQRPIGSRRAERAFSRYTRRRFGIDDILCGAKAYAAPIVRAHGAALDTKSIGTALALAAVGSGARAAVVPVEVHRRTDGSPRFGSGLRAELRLGRAFARAVATDLRSHLGSSRSR
jgi:glycosyltransferase involved in cell wall biosynthesis